MEAEAILWFPEPDGLGAPPRAGAAASS